jgi:glyoxylase-like metal-dependent hydrolase (beta-lactamase superfamily II)
MMFDFQKGRIRFINGGKYPHCHTVFIDDDVRTLIDPACDDKVLKRIHQEKPVEVVINSHCHEDHFLNNYLFPEAELWAHELEVPFFQDIEKLIEIFQDHDDPKEEYEVQARNFLLNEVNYREREPDRLLKDGEWIEFGRTRMQVLHTPGHSPGHLCFYFPEESVLFTADLDLVKAGPYYGDRDSDIDDTIRSLERLAEFSVDTYLSAHGRIGVYDGDPAHIQKYLETISQREEALQAFLAGGPRSIEEIVTHGIIYGNRQVAGAWDLSKSEKSMMLKHLQRLERQGKVIRENGRFQTR